MEKLKEKSPRSARVPLTTILRRLGSVCLVLSGVVFMLQGWKTMTSEEKYLAFLGFTAFLSTAGVVCATWFADTKTARTFLALGAATLPVHFSQLGARLYPAFSGEAYAQTSSYAGTTPYAMLGLLIAGIVITIPVAYLGIAALYRERVASITRSTWRSARYCSSPHVPPG